MTDQHKTRDEIWQRVNDQSSHISEVRSSQAAFDARLGALESAVDTGFRTVSAELRAIGDRVNQPTPPPNYFGLVFLALGLLGMFGSYALLITRPISDFTEKNYGRVSTVEERVTALSERTAALEAQVIMLGKHIDAVDDEGSRRWNSTQRPK